MPINTPPFVHELVICANIFVKKDEKYLILRRSSHKRYAPNVVHPIGGKVDQNENPAQAARREVLEEAGITVKNLELKAVILELAPHQGEPYNWQIFHFVAEYDSGEILQTEEGELLWLTAEEIAKEPLFPSVEALITTILDPASKTTFATFGYDGEKKRIVTSVRES